MYLFQVTGITNQKSIANFGFGLINNEKEHRFQWLCNQLDSFRHSLHIPPPSIVITDKEMALKNALLRVFPDTQQQLCVFHINTNIRAKITAQWKELGASDSDDDDDDEDDLPVQTADEIFDDTAARDETQLEAEEGIANTPQSGDKMSREAMFDAWKRVIYAAQEDNFKAAWASMNKTYNPQQNRILRYISKEYMPWREQWAKCFIDRYRNYSQRVNSPVETAHKDVKSYLITGTGDLLHLHTAIQQMLVRKERDYNQQAAEMMMRQRRKYIQQSWLGVLPIQISYPAVDLLAKQHRFAVAALPTNPEPKPLLPCRQVFSQQYGLPCSHTILRSLLAKEPLTKEVIHPRWWLEKPLDLEEPLLRIRDPDIVTNLRGRPRLPINKKLTIPSSLQAPPTLTPTPTPTPAVRQPRQSQQTTRRLNPSVRRTLTQAEIEEEAPSSQRSRGPSSQRSQSRPSTRGRGTRGRRGRGGRTATAAAATPLSSAVEEVILATQPEPSQPSRQPSQPSQQPSRQPEPSQQPSRQPSQPSQQPGHLQLQWQPQWQPPE